MQAYNIYMGSFKVKSENSPHMTISNVDDICTDC